MTGASSSGETYIVELDRWGIFKDGTNAVATTKGINDAFKWAFDNNYGVVVLPKGIYLIDKGSHVLFKSNTHYKLYGCLFVKETNSNTGYKTLFVYDIDNVTIEDATVKGDRETHDYSSGGTHEGGGGFSIESGRNILIKNCEAYECTGDGFNTGGDFNALGGIAHPGHFEPGDINATGAIDSTKTEFTSVNKFFDVTGEAVKKVGYIYYSGDGYGGYGSGWNLNKVPVKFHFYKADNTYLGYKTYRTYEYAYLDGFPLGTAKVRFSFAQRFDVMSGNPLHYVMIAKTANNVTFLNCKSHHNRRLGFALAGRFITLDGCRVYSNGQPMANSAGTGPGWGLDMEDGYMNNQKLTLRNCEFHDNKNGDFICVSTRGVYLENNKMNHNVLFGGSGDDYLSFNNMYYGSIRGKSITSGVEADGTFCTFRNDSIFNTEVGIDGGNTTFDNCVFTKSSLSCGGETVKILNCKLTYDNPDSSIAVNLTNAKQVDIKNSLFDIRRAKSAFGVTSLGERANLSNVKIIMGDLGTGSGDGNTLTYTKNLIMRDCHIEHKKNSVGTNKSQIIATDSMLIENTLFKNMTISIRAARNSADPYKDPLYVTHIFRNNEVYWDKANKLPWAYDYPDGGLNFMGIPRLSIYENIFRLNSDVQLGDFVILKFFVETHTSIRDNTIITKNPVGITNKALMKFELPYRSGNFTHYPTLRLLEFLADQNNKLINSEIIYVNGLKEIVKAYFTDKPTVNKLNSVPNFGYHNVGDEVRTTNPVPGGYIGWVCTSAGFRAGSWTASKTYNIGNLIENGNNIYEAQNTGKSAPNTPVFPININGAVNDVSGISTWKPSTHYNLTNYVLPSVPNGYFYQSTKVGTTGATEPVWTTTGSITDGQVTWIPQRIITWKNIEKKAVFKPYGLISE